MATLLTNAIPIAAGFVLFDQNLPSGWQRVLQLVAFATIVASGTLLNDPRAQAAEESAGGGLLRRRASAESACSARRWRCHSIDAIVH